MAREHEGLVSVVNRRKMSQYIHTYHQGGVMKTDFENVKVKKQGQPTVESLKSELRTLRESAQKGIQMTWSEIEELETQKSSIMERNFLIQEKIHQLMQKCNPNTDKDAGETYQGWDNASSDGTTWMGWNASTGSGLNSLCESVSHSPNDVSHMNRAIQIPQDKIETDSYGYFEENPEDEYQETTIEMIHSDYECKDPLSASVRALSFLKKKRFWKKNEFEIEPNKSSNRAHPTDEYINELRLRLSRIEVDSVNSQKALKAKISTADENIKMLRNLAEKQEKMIEEKMIELRQLRNSLKQNLEDSHSVDLNIGSNIPVM